MRVSVLDGVQNIKVMIRPIPTPGPNEVLVKVSAVGVCGSDVHYYEHGRIGPYVVENPFVLGHEAAGTIVAAGPGVDLRRIGLRVSIEPQKPCRICEQCKAGRYNLCPEMQFYATPPIDGAFAEYVVIDNDFAHEVPDSVSDFAAALIEPLSVGIWACQKALVSPGSRIFIAGAGPIGLITAQVARAFGATEVHLSDVSSERLAIASRYGATHTYLASDPTSHLGVDAFIDASGAGPAVRSGIATVRAAGRVVLVGLGADNVEIPINILQNREIWLTGVFRYANTWPLGIKLLTEKLVDLDSLVTGVFGLDEVTMALEAGTKPGALKSIVTPAKIDI